MKDFAQVREVIKLHARVPGVIEVKSRKKRGGVLVGPTLLQNWGSGYACLNLALDYVTKRAANPRVRIVTTGITVDGVALTVEQIAAYPPLPDCRTWEEIQARAAYCKALYAELQAQTPAAIKAREKQQHDEYKALTVPGRFGL